MPVAEFVISGLPQQRRQRLRRLVSAQTMPCAHKSAISAIRREEYSGRACGLQPTWPSPLAAIEDRPIPGGVMNRLKRVLFVLALNIVWGSCWVSSANAGVITMGTWATMNPSSYPNAFWNNSSWDGPGLNVGQLITSWGVPVEDRSANAAPVTFACD